jgi:transglutaminase superfamily protein
MRRLRAFLLLRSIDRNLLIAAALLLAAIRYGLQLLPFRTLQRLLASVPRPGSRLCPEQIAWAVMAASAYVPSTCLSRALTAQVLLQRAGFPAKLQIGIAKGPRGQLEGHAWVTSQGKIVIGGETVERYTPLTTFEGERS